MSMKDDYNSCPVCHDTNLITGSDYAYCTKCRWGIKSYEVNVMIDATRKTATDAIERISDYLMANNCIASLENLAIRFNKIVGFDTIIKGMRQRELIDIVTSADGAKQVILTLVPTNQCAWVDVELSFSTDSIEESRQHYRIPCKLNDEQQEDLRVDTEQFVIDWVADLVS
jgi:hypothetical protein